jgi:hypothetical protein
MAARMAAFVRVVRPVSGVFEFVIVGSVNVKTVA